MRLYIIRHADPDYEQDTITTTGVAEALALASRLQRERLTHLYCSPMGRARATAAPTAELLGLPCRIEEWTRELGELRVPEPPALREVAWDLHGSTIHRQFDPARPWYAQPPFDAPVFMETYAKIIASSDAFFARHGYRREGAQYHASEPNRDRIAVFCHGGFGLTWLGHLLNIPVPLLWAGFWLPTTSVTTVLFDERATGSAVPRCLGVGDVSHLDANGLPRLPRGIKANYD
jgi:probable phosphoglycerate mutase